MRDIGRNYCTMVNMYEICHVIRLAAVHERVHNTKHYIREKEYCNL